MARVHFGTAPATKWDDITKDRHVLKTLQQCYTSIEHVDVLVGALSERNGDTTASTVGPLLKSIFLEQVCHFSFIFHLYLFSI